MYVSPNGTAYRIGVYNEEYPDGKSSIVTGQIDKLSESEKNKYIKQSKELSSVGEMNIEDVPIQVIHEFRNYLPEHQAP